jgi:GTP-binding protein HflX
MLFATLDPTMRGMTLRSGQKIILCDTVGFISDLPMELVASFRATLEEIVEADLVLHVQDASSAEASEHHRAVEEIIDGLIDDEPLHMINVLNKIDLVDADARGFQSRVVRDKAVCISAVSGEGIDALLKLLDREFINRRQVLTYDIPSSDGAALAWLYKNGEVINYIPQELSNIVKVALQTPDVGRFEQRFNLEPLH